MPTTVTFYFDPACPFTWDTAKLVMTASEHRGFTIEWQPLSILVLDGEGVPDQHREAVTASFQTLRVFTKLINEGRHQDVQGLYEIIGRSVHEDGESMADATLAAIAELKLDVRDALDDTQFDDQITDTTHSSVASAGGGVGTPLLGIDGSHRLYHGPILDRQVGTEQALNIWDATLTLIDQPAFRELKQGRG